MYVRHRARGPSALGALCASRAATATMPRGLSAIQRCPAERRFRAGPPGEGEDIVRRTGRDASPSRHHTYRLARLLAALLLLVLAAPPAVVSADDPGPTYSLTLTASAERLEVGQQVTLTAKLTKDGVAEKDAEIAFSITGTVNRTGKLTTDEDGEVTFTHTSNQVGEDDIEATFSLNGQELASDEVTVTWFRVTQVTLTPSESFGIGGKSVTLTATVRANDGGSTDGATLNFEVIEGPNEGKGGTVTVEDGTATITYEGTGTWPANNDTDTVEVTSPSNDDVEVTATVRWVRGPVHITLS